MQKVFNNIAVVGLGYVGLSYALLLSKQYNVIGVDTDKNRIHKLNNRIMPFHDSSLEKALKK
jgi:UDPglucose 6-dehydrogenase